MRYILPNKTWRASQLTLIVVAMFFGTFPTHTYADDVDTAAGLLEILLEVDASAARETLASLSDKVQTGEVDARQTAALKARLGDSLGKIVAKGDHPLAFDDVVPVRLLDVHILPGLTRQNGRDRVPVVRSAHHDHIKLRVLDHLAVVAKRFRLLAFDRLDGRNAGVQSIRIDIADHSEIHIRLTSKRLQQETGTSSNTHAADSDSFGCGGLLFLGLQQLAGCGDRESNHRLT